MASPDPPEYVTTRAFRAFQRVLTRDLADLRGKLNLLLPLAEGRADDEAFWRGLRKRLNPLRPVGVLFWAMFIALVSGFGAGLARFLLGH